ncbi:MAG: peptidylprolyl isomerase [Bacteroidales bacterium]|nr:peptidylprolyl isomerase [Bacteroidales bacterium]
MNRIKVLALVLAMLPAVVSAQSWKSKTMMTIGDRDITAGEFMGIYEKNNVMGEVLDKKTVDEYLDLFVDFKLKVIEAESLGMDTVTKFRKEFKSYRTQLAKPYFSNDEITEKLMEEAYERMQWDINAAHILVRCDAHAVPADTLKAYQKAMKIRERIMKGEDFNAVAREVSEDPSARDMKEIPGKRRAIKGNSGELGYFSAFDMVYPFESGAYNTKEGEVSMPVRSSFGYHIIKVNSKTPACGIIDAAHIFLKVDENDPTKTDSLVAEKAKNVYKEIDADGKNWDIIVNRYTDDRGTVPNNGRLSSFRVSQIVPEFITVVKGLQPREFSEPVKTDYGYHIIRLINCAGVKDYDEEKENIRKRIEKDMRASVSEEIVMKRLMKDNKFKEYTKVKDAFIASIDSTLTQGAYVVSPAVDANKVIFKIGKDKYTVQNFIDYIVDNQRSEPFLQPAELAYELYADFVKESVFNYEDTHLETKYPEFELLVNEYHDGILLFDLMEKEVWNKAVKDTTGIQNYYEEHKSEYVWGDRVNAIVITTMKPELVDTLNIIVNQDLDFDSVRAIVKGDRKFNNVSVKRLFFQKGDNVDVDAMTWETGKVAVVPSTVDKTTKIYKILDVRKPEPKTFKETRGIVTSAYQAQMEKEWLKMLRGKYQVTVNEKVLEKVKAYYE